MPLYITLVHAVEGVSAELRSMSGAELQQPSTTQSTGDITARDDVIKTVSVSGVSSSLRRAISDPAPASGGGGGAGARAKDDRRSPTSGAHRGRRTSKPVTTTQSAPEAAAAASTAAASRLENTRRHQGDRAHSSDSDEPTNRDDRWKKKKKKQSTSSWQILSVDDSDVGADTTLSSVIVVEPRTVSASPPSDFSSNHDLPADTVPKTVHTSDSSRWTNSQKKTCGFEAALTNSGRRPVGDDDPTSREVKSEGKQHEALSICRTK